MKGITREDPTDILERLDVEILKQATRETTATYQLLMDLRLFIKHTEAVLNEIQRIGGKHTC